MPAGDKRREDDVGQFGVGVDHLAQRDLRDFIDFGRAASVAAHDCRPAGDLRDVAGELPVIVDHDGLWLVAGFIDDLDAAGDDHEEFAVAVAGAEDASPSA